MKLSSGDDANMTDIEKRGRMMKCAKTCTRVSIQSAAKRSVSEKGVENGRARVERGLGWMTRKNTGDT